MLDVGRPDEREVALVRDREDDALVGVLEDVRVLVVEELAHDHVAALHQAQRLRARQRHLLAQELPGPRTGRIDERACAQLAGLAALALQLRVPQALAAVRSGATRARQDRGATLGGVDRVQHDQPCIVDPAVRIDKTSGELALQRRARRVAVQVHGTRARQHLAPREMVVEEQAGADHPHRAHARVVRHHEAQRPHDVRRALQQHLALGKRFAHQRELVVLEITQAAVDQLGRRRRGVRREVVLLAQHDVRAAPGQVARDAATVDAAADDEHVAVMAAFAGSARCARRARSGGVLQKGFP